jgi:NAD(P)-dependent dehydrogenase (short-subunit alcohol dehydrogenase family)
MQAWTTKDIPSQRGKLVVITGATGGLGYETALALAGAGANVVLTGRNAAKGKAALDKIKAVYPNATISYDHLDLNSLASVKEFTERFKSQHGSLDLLINNAGVMAPPARQTTADGFELQFGTNYLSHFALTAQLLPLLKKGKQPRVVNLSSLAHRFGAIQFDDLQWQRNYKDWPSYAQSKLAMLMFAFELQRRSDANGWGLMSNAAHPGYAVTELQSTGPRMDKNGKLGKAGIFEQIGTLLEPLIAQSAAGGALPTLFAATSPDAKGRGYYGPKKLFEMKGAVGEAFVAGKAKDVKVAAELWNASEQLTHASWA